MADSCPSSTSVSAPYRIHSGLIGRAPGGEVSATEEPTAAAMPSDRSNTAISTRPSSCIPAGSRLAPLTVAQLAANGHRLPAALRHTGPRDTWTDGTSSHVCHHEAILRYRLTIKQVHRESSWVMLTCGVGGTAAAGQAVAAITGDMAPGTGNACAAAFIWDGHSRVPISAGRLPAVAARQNRAGRRMAGWSRCRRRGRARSR